MEEISCMLKNIADKLKSISEKELKKYDLTLSQSRVLLYLNNQGGEAMQKEIQKFLQVTHPTVGGIIARLENKGFVRTWINVKNKKEVVVSLAEKSVFVIEDMERARTERETLLRKGMDDKEIKMFITTLKTIQGNVDESINEDDIKEENVQNEKKEEAFLWFW